jgi:hypothetical protein
MTQPAMQLAPSEVYGLLGQAQAHFSAGRHDAAIETLEAAATLAPSNAAIQFDLGLIERQRGTLELAARRFRKVLALEPGHAPAHALLAGIDRPRRDSTSLASRFLALDSILPDAILVVFDAMRIHDPAGAADYLGHCLRRLAAADAAPAVGMTLCSIGFDDLSRDGNWSDAAKILDEYRTFREAWWRRTLEAGTSTLVIGSPLIPHRIGEMAERLGCLIKAKLLGWFPDIDLVLPVPADGGANPAYLEYWRQWLTFMQAPVNADRIGPHASTYDISFERDGNGRFHGYHDFGHLVERAWHAENRPPLLAVTTRHRERGVAELRRLGVEAMKVVHPRSG